MPLFKRKQEKSGPGFSKVVTGSGTVIGFWFEDPASARNSGLVEAMIARFDLWHWLSANRRVVANTVDGRGGLFVMFGDHPAPGETSPPPSGDTVPDGSGRTLEVNGTSYPLYEDFDAFGRDAAAGRISLLKTTMSGLAMADLVRLTDLLTAAFGADAPETRAVVLTASHCLSCFQGYSAQRLLLREYLGSAKFSSKSALPPKITACVKCGGTEAVWIYDPSLREPAG